MEYLVAQWVKHLPSTQVMILGSWDPALGGSPCSLGSLLLHLFPACAISLTISLIYISYKVLKNKSELCKSSNSVIFFVYISRHIRISMSILTTKSANILIVFILNLHTKSGRIAIFIILSIPIHE